MSHLTKDPPAGSVNTTPALGRTQPPLKAAEKLGGEGGRAPGEKLMRGEEGKKSKGAGVLGAEVLEGEEIRGDELMRMGTRDWELPGHRPNMTFTRGAYRPYST